MAEPGVNPWPGDRLLPLMDHTDSLKSLNRSHAQLVQAPQKASLSKATNEKALPAFSLRFLGHPIPNREKSSEGGQSFSLNQLYKF